MRTLLQHPRYRNYVAWLASIAVIALGFALYRWSEPSKLPSHRNSGAMPRVGIHLENVPFSGYVGESKSWSLWAHSIDLEHSQYSSATSISSATLKDIRNGVVFDSSSSTTGAVTAQSENQPSGSQTKSANSHHTRREPAIGKPVMRFHAQEGRYFVGDTEPLPGQLSADFTSHWQLHLSGDVAITTRDGDTLHASAITVMEIVNRQTHKAEQRLQCDEGATIGRREVHIVANRMRYSIRDHTVELLDGVRATFKAGSFQSQRCFWSLEENVVRIPDPSSGMLDENRFRAERVTLDLTNDVYTATNGKLNFKSDPELGPSIRNAVGMRPK